MRHHSTTWTNSSVTPLASSGNPIDEITRRARSVVFQALERGWSGPPYDVFALAELMQVPLVATESVADARLVPIRGKLHIEYNPNRPRGRVRYSIAHDLAHTLFEDCSRQVRHRIGRSEAVGDEWQLEMLCNIAAAEFLMPVGSFAELRDQRLTIDEIMGLRERFDVSTEALLLRIARLTDFPCFIFCASPSQGSHHPERYRIDYASQSCTWPGVTPPSRSLPAESVVGQCTAVGYTAKGDERWTDNVLHIECVGIPPYPGQVYPRVAGIAVATHDMEVVCRAIDYVKGDATEPRGEGERVIAHVVNDKAPTWGAGFGLCVRKKWPHVQDGFRNWVHGVAGGLRLGEYSMTKATGTTQVFHMICQHGYGPSSAPRIRYEHLHTCLVALAGVARSRSASVHMPRIGAGEAGGRWEVIGELVEQDLCRQGISVTVYDLPSRVKTRRGAPAGLFDR